MSSLYKKSLNICDTSSQYQGLASLALIFISVLCLLFYYSLQILNATLQISTYIFHFEEHAPFSLVGSSKEGILSEKRESYGYIEDLCPSLQIIATA